MKVAAALTVGIVLALAPTGAAHAGDGPNGTAYGNCKISSAGGTEAHTGPAGKGHGSWTSSTKAGQPCATPAPDSGSTPPALDPDLGTSEG